MKLNIETWPPGSPTLWVAAAPHAAAGPYPTAMRPATADEIKHLAARFLAAPQAEAVQAGEVLKELVRLYGAFETRGRGVGWEAEWEAAWDRARSLASAKGVTDGK